ncbi:MAG TPA: ABC transporter ATP-binding protein [Catalimonadaceae bacterium]|nr:ABC transporter ATP-binding protein [Catalimonadaceae bacterium]HPI10293.1 ABC transporter ATP-binding protein [Catalimonadaceae bacterium]
MENEPVLRTKGICKSFFDPVENKVLKDVTFQIERGSFCSIVGKSGCGKSTLLYILSTMDTDFEGELYLDGQSLRGLSNMELARVRNEKIGFVFQFHYLLDEFTVLKNVILPGIKLGKLTKEQLEHEAMGLLKIMGVDDQALKKPNQLSGGQKQRIAIARALINKPVIIMGDEPTGNLDKKNTEIVFDIFKELSLERKQSLLVVTHDDDFARRTDRIIEMEDGRIIKS